MTRGKLKRSELNKKCKYLDEGMTANNSRLVFDVLKTHTTTKQRLECMSMKIDGRALMTPIQSWNDGKNTAKMYTTTAS